MAIKALPKNDTLLCTMQDAKNNGLHLQMTLEQLRESWFSFHYVLPNQRCFSQVKI